MKELARSVLMKGITFAATLCLLTGLLQLSRAQQPTANEPSASLAALQEYLDEECDIIKEKRKGVCGLERLDPYKDDQALKRKLVKILTTGPDQELLNKDVHSEGELRRLRRVYQEKSAMALATIDLQEAKRVLTAAEQRGDKVLAKILSFALTQRPPE